MFIEKGPTQDVMALSQLGALSLSALKHRQLLNVCAMFISNFSFCSRLFDIGLMRSIVTNYLLFQVAGFPKFID